MLVNQISHRHMFAVLCGCVLVAGLAGPVSSEPGLPSHLRQVAPLRQDSVRVPSPADLPKEMPSAPFAAAPAPMPGPWTPCLAVLRPLADMIRPGAATRLHRC